MTSDIHSILKEEETTSINPIEQLNWLFCDKKPLPLTFCVTYPDLSVFWNECEDPEELIEFVANVYSHGANYKIIKACFACVEEAYNRFPYKEQISIASNTFNSIKSFLKGEIEEEEIEPNEQRYTTFTIEDSIKYLYYLCISGNFLQEVNDATVCIGYCIISLTAYFPKDNKKHIPYSCKNIVKKDLCCIIRKTLSCPTYQEINLALEVRRNHKE